MKFIGNTNQIINWDNVVEHLRGQPPAHTGPDNSLANLQDITGVDEILTNWANAGIKTVGEGGSNNWDMYFPNTNFDNKVVEQFNDYVGCDVMFAWIANIHPGNMAHWHWDTSGKEDYFDSIPNLVRYCCFIMKPQPGHVFMTPNQAFSYSEQGDVWQWPDRKMWHGGTNFGFDEKYMFHYIGTTR